MHLVHSYSSIKLYENCPFRYYRQRIAKDIVDGGSEASKHGERIHKFLERRLKTTAELPQEAKTYEDLCKAAEKMAGGGALEIELELALNDKLEPTGWWDADAWLRSKLDVLIIKDHHAVVMDWKTGKRNPDFFQMQLFAAQVFKHFPDVERVKTSLVWLKFMKMDTKKFARQETNALWADILGRINRIYESYENGNWPMRPSGLCRYCSVRHDCPSARI